MPNRRKPTTASTPPSSRPTAIDAGGMANWVRYLRRVNVSMQGETPAIQGPVVPGKEFHVTSNTLSSMPLCG